MCLGCGQRVGMQRQVKVQKFGQYIAMELRKLHPDNVFAISDRIYLDRFS